MIRSSTRFRLFLSLGLVVIPAAGLLGCSSSSNENGFPCALKAPLCPQNYACIENVCWRDGTGPKNGALPTLDAAATPAAPTDGSSFDGLAERSPIDEQAQPGPDAAYDSESVDQSPSQSLSPDAFLEPADAAVDVASPAPDTRDAALAADVADLPPADAADAPLVSDVAMDSAASSCAIGGATFASGRANPTNICQFCDPSVSATAWSSQGEGLPCGAAAGQYCHAGTCTNGCFIAGTFYALGAADPSNACQSCQAAAPTAWSKLADGQTCGGGKVCSAGTCKEGCWIASTFIASGGSNPSNACQICTPSKTTTAWSNNDAATAVSCGTCGGTASCVGGGLGPCSVTASTYYPDSDGDGYGASTGAISACSKPTNYVANNSDCCDADASAHPGQTATFSTADACGSFDYNCDGSETPKSNGPTSCGTSSCALAADGTSCVQTGCAGCSSSCQTYATAACGQHFTTSVSPCTLNSSGHVCTTVSVPSMQAGLQECN
jgi:hypothetical protein